MSKLILIIVIITSMCIFYTNETEKNKYKLKDTFENVHEFKVSEENPTVTLSQIAKECKEAGKVFSLPECFMIVRDDFGNVTTINQHSFKMSDLEKTEE